MPEINVDERIRLVATELFNDGHSHCDKDYCDMYLADAQYEPIKQLIRDVLEYVKPERLDAELVPPFTMERLTAHANKHIRSKAIDEMEAKAKELGL